MRTDAGETPGMFRSDWWMLGAFIAMGVIWWLAVQCLNWALQLLRWLAS